MSLHASFASSEIAPDKMEALYATFPLDVKTYLNSMSIAQYEEYVNKEIQSAAAMTTVLLNTLFFCTPGFKKYQTTLSTNSNISGACGVQWSAGQLAFKCATCESDSTCAVCVSCFFNANHRDHKWRVIKTGGGCCDCGDENAWKKSGNCSAHDCADESQLENDTLLKENYPWVYYYGGVALKRILEVCDTYVSNASAKGIQQKLAGNNLSRTIHWIQSLWNTSTELRCLILSMPNLEDMIEGWFVRANELSTIACEQIESLLLCLMQYNRIRNNLALLFIENYEKLYFRKSEAFGERGLLSLSVQLFTNAPCAIYVAQSARAVSVICKSIIRSLHDLWALNPLDLGSRTIRTQLMSDSLNKLTELRYVLLHKEVLELVLHDSDDLTSIVRLFAIFAATPPSKRLTQQHTLYESMEWRELFLIENRLFKICLPLFEHCRDWSIKTPERARTHLRSVFLFMKIISNTILSYQKNIFSSPQHGRWFVSLSRLLGELLSLDIIRLACSNSDNNNELLAEMAEVLPTSVLFACLGQCITTLRLADEVNEGYWVRNGESLQQQKLIFQTDIMPSVISSMQIFIALLGVYSYSGQAVAYPIIHKQKLFPGSMAQMYVTQPAELASSDSNLSLRTVDDNFDHFFIHDLAVSTDTVIIDQSNSLKRKRPDDDEATHYHPKIIRREIMGDLIFLFLFCCVAIISDDSNQDFLPREAAVWIFPLVGLTYDSSSNTTLFNFDDKDNRPSELTEEQVYDWINRGMEKLVTSAANASGSFMSTSSEVKSSVENYPITFLVRSFVSSLVLLFGETSNLDIRNMSHDFSDFTPEYAQRAKRKIIENIVYSLVAAPLNSLGQIEAKFEKPLRNISSISNDIKERVDIATPIGGKKIVRLRSPLWSAVSIFSLQIDRLSLADVESSLMSHQSATVIGETRENMETSYETSLFMNWVMSPFFASRLTALFLAQQLISCTELQPTKVVSKQESHVLKVIALINTFVDADKTTRTFLAEECKLRKESEIIQEMAFFNFSNDPGFIVMFQRTLSHLMDMMQSSETSKILQAALEVLSGRMASWKGMFKVIAAPEGEDIPIDVPKLRGNESARSQAETIMQKALSNQQALQAKMLEQQKNFMSLFLDGADEDLLNDEDDEGELHEEGKSLLKTVQEREKKLTCSLCSEVVKKDSLAVTFAWVSTSSFLQKTCQLNTNVSHGNYSISSCCHISHLDCIMKHLRSLQTSGVRENHTLRTRDEEVKCPVCRSPSNFFLPYIPLDETREFAPSTDATNIEQEWIWNNDGEFARDDQTLLGYDSLKNAFAQLDADSLPKYFFKNISYECLDPSIWRPPSYGVYFDDYEQDMQLHPNGREVLLPGAEEEDLDDEAPVADDSDMDDWAGQEDAINDWERMLFWRMTNQPMEATDEQEAPNVEFVDTLHDEEIAVDEDDVMEVDEIDIYDADADEYEDIEETEDVALPMVDEEENIPEGEMVEMDESGDLEDANAIGGEKFTNKDAASDIHHTAKKPLIELNWHKCSPSTDKISVDNYLQEFFDATKILNSEYRSEIIKLMGVDMCTKVEFKNPFPSHNSLVNTTVIRVPLTMSMDHADLEIKDCSALNSISRFMLLQQLIDYLFSLNPITELTTDLLPKTILPWSEMLDILPFKKLFQYFTKADLFYFRCHGALYNFIKASMELFPTEPLEEKESEYCDISFSYFMQLMLSIEYSRIATADFMQAKTELMTKWDEKFSKQGDHTFPIHLFNNRKSVANTLIRCILESKSFHDSSVVRTFPPTSPLYTLNENLPYDSVNTYRIISQYYLNRNARDVSIKNNTKYVKTMLRLSRISSDMSHLQSTAMYYAIYTIFFEMLDIVQDHIIRSIALEQRPLLSANLDEYGQAPLFIPLVRNALTFGSLYQNIYYGGTALVKPYVNKGTLVDPTDPDTFTINDIHLSNCFKDKVFLESSPNNYLLDIFWLKKVQAIPTNVDSNLLLWNIDVRRCFLYHLFCGNLPCRASIRAALRNTLWVRSIQLIGSFVEGRLIKWIENWANQNMHNPNNKCQHFSQANLAALSYIEKLSQINPVLHQKFQCFKAVLLISSYLSPSAYETLLADAWGKLVDLCKRCLGNLSIICQLKEKECIILENGMVVVGAKSDAEGKIFYSFEELQSSKTTDKQPWIKKSVTEFGDNRADLLNRVNLTPEYIQAELLTIPYSFTKLMNSAVTAMLEKMRLSGTEKPVDIFSFFLSECHNHFCTLAGGDKFWNPEEVLMLWGSIQKEIASVLQFSSYVISALWLVSDVDLTKMSMLPDEDNRRISTLEEVLGVSYMRPMFPNGLNQYVKRLFEVMFTPMTISEHYVHELRLSPLPRWLPRMQRNISDRVVFAGSTPVYSADHINKLGCLMPDDYYNVLHQYLKRRCAKCKTAPTEPAVCLSCNAIVCLDSPCCQFQLKNQTQGECCNHSLSCNGGSGMFLLILSSMVLVVGASRSQRCMIMNSPFVDIFDECDPYLTKERKLTLSVNKLKELQEMFMRGDLEQQIIKKTIKTGRLVLGMF